MLNAIKQFPKQFLYEPVLGNALRLGRFNKFVVAGMGGSRLPALILQAWKPSLPLIIHNDYGLPALPEDELRTSLIVVSSYSGNTEEALDAYELAREKGYAVAAISVGGRLLEWARHCGPWARASH